VKKAPSPLTREDVEGRGHLSQRRFAMGGRKGWNAETRCIHYDPEAVTKRLRHWARVLKRRGDPDWEALEEEADLIRMGASPMDGVRMVLNVCQEIEQ